MGPIGLAGNSRDVRPGILRRPPPLSGASPCLVGALGACGAGLLPDDKKQRPRNLRSPMDPYPA
jgi:hypothetical protein